MSEQEHQDVVDRLRALGREPVPSPVAAAHLAAITDVRARVPFARHAWRVAVVAMVALFAMTGAAAVAFVGSTRGDVAEKVATAGPGGVPAGQMRSEGVDGPDDPCTGPPPFAGVVPDSGQTRAGEAAEHSSIRQDCPATDGAGDDAAPDGTTDAQSAPASSAVVDPHPDDPCTGPPPFAGVVPDSGQTRAEEAAEHSSIRQECPADDTTPATGSGGVQSAGPPAGTPAGPPDGVGGGPPVSTPAGPPDGVGSGPPESIPGGPPEGAVDGSPSGTPAGTSGRPAA